VKESSSGASGRGALAEFKEAVTSLFDQVVGLAPDLGFRRDFPRHELLVEDDGYRARVELPGLRRDEVEVSISGRTLTISGERPPFKPPSGARMLRSERPSGGFSLTIRLPAEVDVLGVTARMRDGVLEIGLPKLGGSRGRSIEVESSDEATRESAARERGVEAEERVKMPWEEEQA
jgi:HSP20 family protein